MSLVLGHDCSTGNISHNCNCALNAMDSIRAVPPERSCIPLVDLRTVESSVTRTSRMTKRRVPRNASSRKRRILCKQGTQHSRIPFAQSIPPGYSINQRLPFLTLV